MHNIRIKGKLILANSCFVDGSSEEVAIEDLLLLIVSVTVQVDLLHTVQQRLGDVALVVSRTDEQDIG